MDTAEMVAVEAQPKIGAPTTYKPEYCQAIIDFFMQERKSKRVSVSSEVGGKDGWKKQYRTICGELPSLSGFALSIGVARQTLWDWRKRHSTFDDACARAQQIAEGILTERANNGLYSAQFAGFYAKNVFGWKDKTEIETVSSQDSQDMAGMRAALAAATPDELAQIAGLFDKIQSRAKLPAIEP